MSLTRRSTLAGAGAAAIAGLTLATGVAKAEEHVEIRRAIDALEHARDYLIHAEHDFGGHREHALRDCDAALVQLREALKFDRH
ncbi:MAG TPA: hypothetical protein VEJ16_02950 [Alphaproteobacteria bacterium]|nr:hypothetical protein [Alphaproteobacteria bacterium]